MKYWDHKYENMRLFRLRIIFNHEYNLISKKKISVNIIKKEKVYSFEHLIFDIEIISQTAHKFTAEVVSNIDLELSEKG